EVVVRLTERPYSLTDFRSRVRVLNDRLLRRIPRSTLAGVFPTFHAGYYDRQAYRLRMAKHQPELAKALAEVNSAGADSSGPSWLHVLDAIDVHREEIRMIRETANADT
ncbi:MAG: hypothetical protein ABIF77_04225, partial [bacterium]